MKSSKMLKYMIFVTALVMPSIPTMLLAQQQPARHSDYKVVDLGTFGGPNSDYEFGSRIINRHGVVVGGADTSVFDENCGCFVGDAFRWENGGVITDLGVLPGGVGAFPIAINSKGAIAGISGTAIINPVNGVLRADVVLWKDGQIIDLGSLGGPFIAPNDINNRGQVVGGGENTIPDPFAADGGTTEVHAFLWDGTMRDLGTLGGHDSFAAFINERGQIAGNSTTNSVVNPTTQSPTQVPVLWENGRVRNLGSLGGLFGYVTGFNNRGQVSGDSDLAGDEARHPFVWQGGSLRDLGTLGGSSAFSFWIDESGRVVGGSFTSEKFRAFSWEDGKMRNLGSLNFNSDVCSVALNSNSKGQIVGNSLPRCENDAHPFLWEGGGPMIDLNIFVPPGSGILLHEAYFINDEGIIAVSGRIAGDEDHERAFVLVPVERGDASAGAEQASAQLAQSSAQKTTAQAPVSPDAIAAFAARYTHRFRSFPRKAAK